MSGAGAKINPYNRYYAERAMPNTPSRRSGRFLAFAVLPGKLPSDLDSPPLRSFFHDIRYDDIDVRTRGVELGRNPFWIRRRGRVPDRENDATAGPRFFLRPRF